MLGKMALLRDPVVQILVAAVCLPISGVVLGYWMLTLSWSHDFSSAAHQLKSSITLGLGIGLAVVSASLFTRGMWNLRRQMPRTIEPLE